MDVEAVVKSVLRTVIPWMAAGIITLAAKAGLEIDSETAAIIAYGLIGTAYFTIGRVLETRWPGLGRALLSFGLVKSKPVYFKPEVAQSAAATTAAKPSGGRRIL